MPVRYADGKVDIKVITKDVWTLSPGISFGRAGGTNSTNFNLQDTNFLGWGKALQVSRGSTVDRTSNTVAWSDPNVFGSRWTSAAAYVDSSDGTERVVQVAHPFYSLDAPWSTKITAVKFDRTISRYNLGDIVDQFNDNESSYELSGGISNGLIDGWTKRLTFGMRYDRNLFLPTPGTAHAGAAAAARPDPVLSLRRIRYSSGQVQESRRRESDRPNRGSVFRHRSLGRGGFVELGVRRGPQRHHAGRERCCAESS